VSAEDCHATPGFGHTLPADENRIALELSMIQIGTSMLTDYC
jgi:hypothetical protein